MANPEHVAKFNEGVQAWNRWRLETPNVMPDLSEYSLNEFKLDKIDLSGANLLWADFRGASLGSANLQGAFLFEANLTEADLSSANFTRARFTRSHLDASADLSRAYLHEAVFVDALLGSTNLNACHMSGTILCNVDLSRVKGLEGVHHYGPSEISISTIYRSNGQIPESFLRGAGLSNEFITFYQRILQQHPVPFLFHQLFKQR